MFCENLKLLMTANRITAKSLADKIGVSVSCVSLWMSGVRTPKFKQMVAISEFFNCSLDKLAGLKQLVVCDGCKCKPVCLVRERNSKNIEIFEENIKECKFRV